ncbi:hypothetical protein FSHL1_000369 [Fusarium sambucinum]
MAPIKLPECNGPSLGPFPHNIIDEFQFLEVLNCDSRHGVIVKAKWRNQLYAIKLFISAKRIPIPYQYKYSPEYFPDLCCEHFDWHFTPFENECRAFGRLQEVGCEHVAVKVYGYVRVISDQVKEKLPSYQRWLFQTLTDGNATPQMMGIVKDWVEMAEYKDKNLRSLYDRFYQVFHMPQMIENLHELHKNGIVVRDLRKDQYVNGVLVDLSCSATAPHPYGPPSAYQPLWTFSSLAAWDLYAFQLYIILSWDKEYEHLEKRLVKPRGMPNSCPFTAYTYPFSSAEAKKKAIQPYGPFLPMLNHFRHELFATEPPRWDPQEYLENR